MNEIDMTDEQRAAYKKVKAICKKFEELEKISPTMGAFSKAVDALSWYDFPLSIEKILEFYELLEEQAHSIAEAYCEKYHEEDVEWALKYARLTLTMINIDSFKKIF